MNKKRGGRKPAINPKDKVLHARISEDLDQQLKEQAESLGLSVSSIVRNVLLNTFNLVEGVVADSANLAFGRELHSAQQSPEPRPGNVKTYGWQSLVMNVNAVCQQCNDLLPKGSPGAIGVPTNEPPVFLCPTCLELLQDGAS